MKVQQTRSLYFRMLLISSSLLTILAGCQSAAPTPQGVSTAPAAPLPTSVAPALTTQALSPTSAAPVKQGNTITIGIFSEPLKLDPASSGDASSLTVYDYMVEGLVGWGKSGKLEPALATSWQFSQDGTQVTLNLRKGVKFHDGTDFNAQAVKATFDRIIDPDLKLVGNAAFKNSIKSVNVVNDYTIRFDFLAPTASFIFDLSNSYAKILSPDSLKRPADEITTHPIGTGPFRFVEWMPKQQIVVEAFNDYWKGRAAVDRIVFKPIPEPAARLAAFEAGNIDIALNPPFQDVERLRADSRFQVVTAPGAEALHVVMNLRKKTFQDVRIRQALNYAVDKESIVKSIYKGLAVPLDSPISIALPAHASVGSYQYDLAKAKQLLAAAGYDQEQKLVMWAPNGRYLNDRQLAETVVNYLKEAGLDVQLEIMDYTTYISKLRAPPADQPPEYDLAINNAQPGSGDADQVWNLMIGCKSWPPTYFNIAFYCSSDVDALIQKERATFDENQRNQVNAEIEKTIWNDAPWIFLLSPPQIAVVSSRVKDTYFTMFGISAKEARIEQ